MSADALQPLLMHSMHLHGMQLKSMELCMADAFVGFETPVDSTQEPRVHM